MGTNHLIFRIKSYNQNYKIILVPSMSNPIAWCNFDKFSVNIILTIFALFLNMALFILMHLYKKQFDWITSNLCQNILKNI